MASMTRAFPTRLALVATVAIVGCMVVVWAMQRSASPPDLRAAIASGDSGSAVSSDVGTERAQLEWRVRQVPNDGRAWALLARLAFAEERFADAATAYGRALAVSSKVARDPLVWCEYADAVAMSHEGVLAGLPRALVDRALQLDPDHARALEMAGGAAYEAGEFAQAAAFWRKLLPQLRNDRDAHEELLAAIERAERKARVALPRQAHAASTVPGEPS